MPRPRMIYLMGLDRSGSTITGAILGNHPEIAYFGELQYFPRAILENRILAGGHTISEGRLWQDIHKSMKARFGEQAVFDFMQLKNKYERWRHLPLMLVHFTFGHSAFKRYLAYNAFLVDELLRLSSKTVICDSSKNAVRRIAFGLSGLFELRTFLLVRDVRGYCWSLKKRARRAGASAAVVSYSLKWVFNNLIFAVIALSGRFVIIRYEALVDNPGRSFETIGKKINLGLSGLAELIRSRQPIQISNVISGSPGVRNRASAIVSIDDAWEQGLSKGEKRLAFMLAGWLAVAFGYTK